MIKTLSELGMRGKFFKLVLLYLGNPISTHRQLISFLMTRNWKFPLTLAIRQGCLLSPLISTALKILIMLLDKKRKQKVNMEKEEIKLLFVDDMIVYEENLKESIKKKTVGVIITRLGYKVNIQKIFFLF